MTGPLSVPPQPTLPRDLSAVELQTLLRAADVLIPAHGAAVAASAEDQFVENLQRTLLARSDAFDAIVAALDTCRDIPAAELLGWFEQLDAEDPGTFQALSTVIAGAWLLTPGVRRRIGYQGLVASRAKHDDAADDISSGLLDPVLDRGNDGRWLR